MTNSLDFEKFRSLLYDASRTAFLAIQEAHAGENFYLFALLTTGDMNNVIPTSSTDEGLTRAAQKYADKEWGQGKSLEQLRTELKWSPGDSPLLLEGVIYFKEVNTFLVNFEDLVDDLSDDEFDAFVAQYMGTCVDVLKQLDHEGLFGENEQRNDITINLLMGDQSDEDMKKYAKLLNPVSVYERFCRELASQA